MTPTSKAPWHHWPVAVLTLVFYALAALDYALSKLGVSAYLGMFPPDVTVLVTGLSLWVSAIWAIGVWGGLAGAWLLWKRNRWSVLLLFAGAVAMVFLTVWLSLFTRPTIFGAAGFIGFYLMVGSAAIAVLIYIYARWERTEHKLA
ncbi:hypothetical protein DKT77_08680 [Meridianimarinicoccus roseus]|jgi:hypothetical protein|uniref:DUF4175 domain-containing protein n=1 Tax=Meridianimarinicoccus roseus TaxID=2072018 RepID=A0A2V2LCE6_9RHOB|nr:hypothetical protein [Meridianimarinicoccus roseus]PWR03005.1 hypothetical protein DKT77_08680 [Meridianimarinicoccus roseus]